MPFSCLVTASPYPRPGVDRSFFDARAHGCQDACYSKHLSRLLAWCCICPKDQLNSARKAAANCHVLGDFRQRMDYRRRGLDDHGQGLEGSNCGPLQHLASNGLTINARSIVDNCSAAGVPGD